MISRSFAGDESTGREQGGAEQVICLPLFFARDAGGGEGRTQEDGQEGLYREDGGENGFARDGGFGTAVIAPQSETGIENSDEGAHE